MKNYVLFFYNSNLPSGFFFCSIFFFWFLAEVKKSSLREHSVFSAQVSSFTRRMLSQAKNNRTKKEPPDRRLL